MKKQLKYQNDIKGIADCPPAACNNIQVVGYRSVFEDLTHKNNFMPVALIDVARKTRQGVPIRQCCKAFSLSLYQSLDQLRSNVKRIEKFTPQFQKKVGSYFAELHISPSDGICGDVLPSGHFSFFEYDGFSAKTAVTVHDKLLP